MEACPAHPGGGCSFARHGTYGRAKPGGTRIARWYCRQAQCTFSLLPDCLAARLSGSLEEVEAAVVAVEGAPSVEAAADRLRPDIDLPGALRWTRHRLGPVHRALNLSNQVPKELPLPPSTVHRLLVRHGLRHPCADAPNPADRRRFAFERARQLWMSDVMHGPAVVAADRRTRKTYLIAFIDDATRVIPYAAFAHAENTQAFLPVLKQAILRRGFAERLYVEYVP